MNIRLCIALTALLAALPARAQVLRSEAGFPWTYTPEQNVPGYLQFRAEGLSLAQAAKYSVSYMRKWKAKKFTAPREELAWFDAQRALQKYLRREPPPAGKPVRMAFAGDVMWIRNQWNRFVTPPVLEAMARYDAVLGNLESPIARSQPVPSWMPDCRAYNSDPGLVKSFARADGRNLFTALATANNHSLDMGDEGALETNAFLDEEGIAHSGMAKRGGPRWTSFERGGIRFGFYAATWGLNDPASLLATTVQLNHLPGFAPERDAPADLRHAAEALAGMRAAGCDVRIVYVHWGFEYEYYPSPRVMQEARRLVEAGADLVLGSHAHVQQPAEVCLVNGYEERYQADPAAAGLAALQPGTGCLLRTADGRPRKALVIYSLGNFTTTMLSDITRIAWMPEVTWAKDAATGTVDWHGLASTWLYNKVPTLTSRTRRLTLLGDGPTGHPELDAPWLGDGGTLTPLEYLKKHVGAD